jgi:transposase
LLQSQENHSANKVADLLERDAHTLGGWVAAFAQNGPAALAFEQTGGPPALDHEAQAGLKVAVQAAPAEVGLALANWTWKVVRQFVEARCGVRLCRSACPRYLHQLGFVYKRPKNRLLKADEEKRAAFVREYVALLAEARAAGAKISFADEAHFRADADLQGKWVPKGRPALVDSTCPR